MANKLAGSNRSLPPTFAGLTNCEIKKYYQNKRRLHGIYSKDSMPKKKDGDYVINVDEYSDIGTDWIALYSLNNDVTFLIVLELNIFQKKLKYLLEIKT